MQALSTYQPTACHAPDTENNMTADTQSIHHDQSRDTTGEPITMSQEYLYKHNIGTTRAVNAELFKLSLSEPLPFYVKTNVELYKMLCNTSKSYQHLVTRVVHSVISQHIWLRKARESLEKKKNPDKTFVGLGDITFRVKIQMAFNWIMRNSQESFSPCLLYTSPSPRD